MTPDLSDPETFAAGLPHEAFADLRSRPGLYWNEMADDDGFWAVTSHEDIVTVSRDTATYSSALGHIQLYTIDDDALEARASMIDMDPPMHTRLRRLVSSAFTPRHVQSYLVMIRQRASTLLDAYLADGGGDFVAAISKPLPVGVICDILGVPEADHDYIVEMTDHLVEGTSARPLDPGAYGNTTELRLLPFNSPAAHAVNEYARRLGDERRAHPTDDLMSKLVLAEVEGEHLTDAEIARFFQLMIFAGNETTRSTISHLALAMAEFADEFNRLRQQPELIDTAVEEIIRWTSAILYFRRTATVDHVLSGTEIRAGQKVVMWYASANYDEAVFDDPYTFDVARLALPTHVAFGGGGAHFCLGASLARLELKILIEEFLARDITLEAVGEPERVRSNFVNGLERAHFRTVPDRASPTA